MILPNMSVNMLPATHAIASEPLVSSVSCVDMRVRWWRWRISVARFEVRGGKQSLVDRENLYCELKGAEALACEREGRSDPLTSLHGLSIVERNEV